MSPGAINKRRRGREAGTRGRLPDGDPCCSPKRVVGPPRPCRKPKLTTVSREFVIRTRVTETSVLRLPSRSTPQIGDEGARTLTPGCAPLRPRELHSVLVRRMHEH
ncbi:hypothetical protein NDU88_007822 [Pleurodeles waltl]|uniref:Uncharacterized protein n=1 Tax=Pleurodeles waltl TaxID=8319 RepID=A0AAV7VUR5_PLEWA|nr:hypothetical protein NDU88_007822 [Pleurodeles waltl]